jgi:hypothetical protein
MYLWINCKTQMCVNTYMLRTRNRGLVLVEQLHYLPDMPISTVVTAPHQTTSTLLNIVTYTVWILLNVQCLQSRGLHSYWKRCHLNGWLASMLQGHGSPIFKGQKPKEEVFIGHFPYGTISQRNEFLKFTIVKA